MTFLKIPSSEKSLKSLALIIALVGAVNFALAQTTLLPRPQKLELTQGATKIDAISLTDNSLKQASSLLETIELPLGVKGTKMHIALVDSIPSAGLHSDETYALSISKKGINIKATSTKGLYWGAVTLKQLLDEYAGRSIPHLEIIDWPLFEIRGLMQDVGRRYISMDELKRQVRVLSRYKMNVFHWHLTEHHGWRLESKLYPQLAAADNMTRDKGGYYTQQEARELMEYCKAHNVMLIPEIDMPGHSDAFIRAFGVDMQSPRGTEILKELLAEACEVFDSVPYLHIGTDEAHFTSETFCDEMVEHVRSLGKKVISWNPGWDYKAGEIDMTQMWSYRGKPTVGVPAIDSKYHYLNHFDVFADIVGLYTSRIGNVESGDGQIAGSILAIWHDRMVENERKMADENSLYPNLLALAQRAWLGGGYQYYDEMGTNLVKGSEAFDDFVDFESRMLWHKKHNFEGYPFSYVKQSDAQWMITDPFPNEGDLAKSFEPEKELKENYQYQGKEYGTKLAYGSGFYLRHPWGEAILKGFYEKPQPNHTAYAWTWVYSPVAQEVGLWFETQNYSRSEKDIPPTQGTWDYKKSQIWINDQLVSPPVWVSSHTVKSNEIPLSNENMVSRDPRPVKLKQGWNKVLVKLPVAGFTSAEVRLVKWMFEAAFVTMDGRDRAPGLIYSVDMTLP